MGRLAEICSPPSLPEAPALTMPQAAMAPHCCFLITGDRVSSTQEQLPSVGGASLYMQAWVGSYRLTLWIGDKMLEDQVWDCLLCKLVCGGK